MALTQTYPYSSDADKEIFANLVDIVKSKLEKNLRINLNEAIALYSAFVVSELQDGKSKEQIQKNAPRLLSPGRVMIGVPETMQKMSFEISLGGISKTIVLNTPITVSDYILKSS